MLSDDFEFRGFSASDFTRLLRLLGYRRDAPPKRKLIVVEEASGRAIAAFTNTGEIVDVREYSGHTSLPGLCSRHGCPRGVMIREGVMERVFDDAGARLPADGDLLEQILPIFVGLRDAVVRGEMFSYPSGTTFPLPTAAMVRRAIDHVLPDGRSLVIGVWHGKGLYTAVVLRRQRGKLDLCAGPQALSEWTGPLGGDFHRDHRTITRAVDRAVAPVHLGLFAERAQLEALLRTPEPGAWLRAFALREVVFDPAPAYVGAAMATDAALAVADRIRGVLGGFALLDQLQPLAGAMRDQFGTVSSLTRLLGFNPLEALAGRLQDTPPGPEPDDD